MRYTLAALSLQPHLLALTRILTRYARLPGPALCYPTTAPVSSPLPPLPPSPPASPPRASPDDPPPLPPSPPPRSPQTPSPPRTAPTHTNCNHSITHTYLAGVMATRAECEQRAQFEWCAARAAREACGARVACMARGLGQEGPLWPRFGPFGVLSRMFGGCHPCQTRHMANHSTWVGCGRHDTDF